MLVIQLKIHLLTCKFAFHKADLTFKISKLTDIMGHVLPYVLGNKFLLFSVSKGVLEALWPTGTQSSSVSVKSDTSS